MIEISKKLNEDNIDYVEKSRNGNKQDILTANCRILQI